MVRDGMPSSRAHGTPAGECDTALAPPKRSRGGAGCQGGAGDHHGRAGEAEDHHGGAEDHQSGAEHREVNSSLLSRDLTVKGFIGFIGP